MAFSQLIAAARRWKDFLTSPAPPAPMPRHGGATDLAISHAHPPVTPSSTLKRKRSATLGASSDSVIKLAKKSIQPSSDHVVHQTQEISISQVHDTGGSPRPSSLSSSSDLDSKSPRDRSTQTSAEDESIDNQPQPFRLLDLPDELWTKIGKMVIDDLPSLSINLPPTAKELKAVGTDDTSKGVDASLKQADKTAQDMAASKYFHDRLLKSGHGAPAILRTCHQLRKELRSYYYHANQVQVTIDLWTCYNKLIIKNVGQYLKMIGPEARRQLRSYEVLSGEPFLSHEPTPEPPEFVFGPVEYTTKLHREPCLECARECGYDLVGWSIKFL
ncbi:uncharacterized protein MYCGRDRAFT_92895 [Zymoseptoria tritici IPO323]|uniref:Uncharacterized protein n=1 Tax=Zymoseptoria tritici (strain CBS 115943 / IPO323) TaxID=336722 RepID=F9X997_ZYMTI|nr:uncharacterized protein MYCGRDRAFT_92895 [Zymoseptoria tritici IPO323]EGP88186.1 hypothetical protein MYCGRDRAFT_92895 [Zymoseptoria tritici IPO323]